MTGEQVIFIGFSVICIGCGLGVVLAKNLFHAALWLAVTFLAVGSVYILLDADFVGMSQIIVYVGAISILMLFAIMMTEDVVGAKVKPLRSAYLYGLPLVVAVGVILFKWFVRYKWQVASPLGDKTTAQIIGQGFITKYIFAFELVSVILLASLVGAIMLAREDKS